MIDWIKKYKHFIFMHLIIFIWGFTGVLGKALEPMPSQSIVFYRTLIGFIALGLFLVISKRGLKISKSMLVKTFGIGILIALHWVTFFQAIHYSNVSFALIFFSTAALFTAFIEPIVMKKKFDTAQLIMGVVVAGGISIIGYDSIMNQSEEDLLNPNSNYGLAIASSLISAFLASLFSTLNAVLVNQDDAVKITFYELLSGCIVVTLIFLGIGKLGTEELTINMYQLWLLLVLGVICTAFAFYVGVYLMKFISPFTMNLSVNMEPIYAIILALAFFGSSEVMSPLFYVGATIVIGAVFFNAWLVSKRKKKT